MGVDPEKVAQKRQKIKTWAYSSGIAAVLALAIFAKPLFHYMRELAKTNDFTAQLISKRTAESIYTPVQSDDWRETYTGNLLYLRNYYEAKTDPGYEKQWALRLNDLEFLRSLKINEDEMAEIIGKESAMVFRLWELRQSVDAKYLDEGLARMNEAELQTTKEVAAILKSEDSFDKFRRLERDFTLQFLKRKFGSAEVRAPTGDTGD